MTHPCNHYSCCENYHGECYGEGCKLNPMPAPSEQEAEDGESESDDQLTTKTKGEKHT